MRKAQRNRTIATTAAVVPGFSCGPAGLSRGSALWPRRPHPAQVRIIPHPRQPGITEPWASIFHDRCGPQVRTQTRTAVLSPAVLRNTGPGEQGGPGGPGHGHPGGPDHDGPGAPGRGGPGRSHEGPCDPSGFVQGGPGRHTPGAGQGTSGGESGQEQRRRA